MLMYLADRVTGATSHPTSDQPSTPLIMEPDDLIAPSPVMRQRQLDDSNGVLIEWESKPYRGEPIEPGVSGIEAHLDDQIVSEGISMIGAMGPMRYEPPKEITERTVTRQEVSVEGLAELLAHLVDGTGLGGSITIEASNTTPGVGAGVDPVRGMDEFSITLQTKFRLPHGEGELVDACIYYQQWPLTETGSLDPEMCEAVAMDMVGMMRIFARKARRAGFERLDKQKK